MKAPFKTLWQALRKSTRARRIPIRIALAYRAVGETEWHPGVITNISRSGVLFKGEQIIRVGVPVEMNFHEPVEIGRRGRAVVSCRGRVVRTLLPPAKDAPIFAAEVSEYLPKRRPDDPVREIIGDDRGPMSGE
jgi:hypothetical protein